MEILFWHAKEEVSQRHLATRLIRDKVFDTDGSMIVNLLNIADQSKHRARQIVILAAEVYSKELERHELIGSVFYFPKSKEVHIYVKDEHRCKGVARRLLAELRTAYKLTRTLLFSWGAMGESGKRFFEKNFVHEYIQEFGDYNECIEAARLDGFGDNVFKHINSVPIAEKRKALRAHAKIHSK